MGGESWHEERDRLLQLLEAIGSGEVTHIDEEGTGPLKANSPENFAVLQKRLATLNDRLGLKNG